MQIQIHLPGLFEADAAYDAEKRILTITPTPVHVALASIQAIPVAGLRVVGAGGAQLDGMLVVNGKTGQLRTTMTKDVPESIPFDKNEHHEGLSDDEPAANTAQFPDSSAAAGARG